MTMTAQLIRSTRMPRTIAPRMAVSFLYPKRLGFGFVLLFGCSVTLLCVSLSDSRRAGIKNKCRTTTKKKDTRWDPSGKPFIFTSNDGTGRFKVHARLNVSGESSHDVIIRKKLLLRSCPTNCDECREKFPKSAPGHWFFTSLESAEQARDRYFGVVACLRDPKGHSPTAADMAVAHPSTCSVHSGKATRCACTHREN
jgi:hypothetical protein